VLAVTTRAHSRDMVNAHIAGPEKGHPMKFTVTCIAAALTAAAIALAPTAMAAPSPATTAASSAAAPTDPTEAQQSCMSLGGTQNECQSPGNAQIYDAPPQVDYFPYAGGAT
jgi:uncharacterized membrane protein